MSTAVLLMVVLLCWLVAVVAWRLSSRRRDRASQITLGIGLHRGLDPAAVEAFLTSFVGLRPGRWTRAIDVPTVTLEAVGTAGGVSHFLHVAERHRRRVEVALQTYLPTVRVEHVEPSEYEVRTAAEYRLSNPHRTLQVTPNTTRLMLAGLASVHNGQRAVVQWILTPGTPPPMPHVDASPKSGWQRLFPRPAGALDSAAQVSDAKKKLASAVLAGVLRIGALADSRHDEIAILRSVESALHLTSSPGVHLRRRLLPKALVAARARSRRVPFGAWPVTVNVNELATLIGWPTGHTAVPGVSLIGSRQLTLSQAVPTTGTMIGDGVAFGAPRPAALDLNARTRHLLMLGVTGVGKTTLQVSMILDDIAAGYGVFAVDPKGSDLVDGVLERLDPRHHQRVVVLDPADVARPIGINPLRPVGVTPDLAAEQLVGIAHRLWFASWGPRSDDIWRAAVRTLVLDPDATINDITMLLTDRQFRSVFMARVTDPFLTAFWRAFNDLTDNDIAARTAPVLNKVRAISARPGLRRIFGQPHASFDLSAHLNHGGIVLVPLNSGLIGEDAAALFAAVLLAQVWNTIQQRASQPPERRHPLMVHLDELSRFAALPLPLEEVLSQARSYRVGLTMSAQHLHQLSQDLRHTVLSNPRSRIVFQIGGTDARMMASEFGSGLTAEDFTGLEPYEVLAQLHAAGRTQPAATLRTRPPGPVVGDARLVRERSRQQWGADGSAIDQALSERLHLGSTIDRSRDSGPVGRKRRNR